MQKIKAWFQNGCAYDTGVELYIKYGDNSFLKKQFAKGFTSFNDFTLKAELRKILSVLTSIVPVPAVLIPRETGELKKFASAHEFLAKPTEIDLSPVIDKTELNKRYLQLIKKKERLYMELNVHMGERHHLPEGFLLHDCARSILTKHQQLTEIWTLIDHYQVHQKFPEEIRDEKLAIDPEKEIQLLRSAISKANSRLKKENCRNRLTTQKTLEGNQARLNELLANRAGK